MIYGNIKDYQLNLKLCKYNLENEPYKYGNFAGTLLDYLDVDFNYILEDLKRFYRLKESLVYKFLEYLIIAKTIHSGEDYDDFLFDKQVMQTKLDNSKSLWNYTDQIKSLKAKDAYSDLLHKDLIALFALLLKSVFDEKLFDIYGESFYSDDFKFESLYLFEEELAPIDAFNVVVKYKTISLPLRVIHLEDKGKGEFFDIKVKPLSDVYAEISAEDIFRAIDKEIENIHAIASANLEIIKKYSEILKLKYKVSEDTLNKLKHNFNIKKS